MAGRALFGARETEHERLQGELTILTEQFAAANEVLSAVGRSAGDPDAVLTTIVESACRLCRSQAAQLYLFEDGYYRLSKAVGMSAESIRYLTEHPIPMDRGSLVGRAGLERATQQIPDVLADPDFNRQDLQRVAGFRTTMGAPMLVDDEVVGALAVWRNEVMPFSQGEQNLVTGFAGQAAMAVNSVKLVQQLEARGAELARRVGELEALREVGETVNSSLDVSKVLSTIAKHAVEISATDGGSIMEYDEGARCFLVRSVYQTDPSVIERLRTTRIHLDETLVGRAAKVGRPLAVSDLDAAELDPHLSVLYDAGWRSLVAVPLLRGGQIVGSLVVRRKRPGEFSAETLTLLEMFADQSTLALLNAQLYRELTQRSAELEVASRHKSEFLASMSHELRTPLNAVLGFSEVLLERMFGELNERQEEYLRDIHGSGKHLLELLNEILDLSKVEAGRMELEYSTFPLRRVLDNTAAMLRERATVHGIDLRVEVGPGIDEVYADELRLKQVVLNLTTNAVKFTGDGGSVVVRATRSGAEVHISVTDTGRGVPPEDRERIFESFQQGGRGPSQEEGTGLGLTLSRRIVELLGGRMWLDSEVGVGSTFGFSLRSRANEHRPDTTTSVGDVVVIEDDRPSIDLITAYLTGAALRVTVAEDGQSGLDAVRRVRPAAVLLDIRLPGIDGWAVLQALKAEPETRDIPVVVVSIVDEQARGAALGAAAYLVKPVSRDALLRALRAVGATTEGDAR
ncbi:GAF domain-containing protein [Kribbella sp. VKM Ac-2569]|uniref:hybrid sensor histidine kinase/response regulator n=1 Tax=Kribbella sp. VKM Ac-2569 TaxID=2512220 RepID=UPI00102BDCC3|nr:GAF domain-containing protein [Kribbella sp. VKM Ac-2569]RZT12014.1 GAF domain-containing protein [Kribbella sp. VKM Ac-2569]